MLAPDASGRGRAFTDARDRRSSNGPLARATWSSTNHVNHISRDEKRVRGDRHSGTNAVNLTNGAWRGIEFTSAENILRQKHIASGQTWAFLTNYRRTATTTPR